MDPTTKRWVDELVARWPVHHPDLAATWDGSELLVYGDGAVDEFSVYDRALDADAVQSIHAAGASGKCR